MVERSSLAGAAMTRQPGWFGQFRGGAVGGLIIRIVGEAAARKVIMHPSRFMAEQLADTVWCEGCRCAIIEASPMRPGRGRRRSRRKGQRLESDRTMDRYDGLVSSIVGGLRTGSLSPDAARQKVREARLESFVRVAANREEAVEAFEDFYGEGYYLW
jgi:hypothetical protein